VQGPIELTLEASERDVEQESTECKYFLVRLAEDACAMQKPRPEFKVEVD
jgi:hypothetical protein